MTSMTRAAELAHLVRLFRSAPSEKLVTDCQAVIAQAEFSPEVEVAMSSFCRRLGDWAMAASNASVRKPKGARTAGKGNNKTPISTDKPPAGPGKSIPQREGIPELWANIRLLLDPKHQLADDLLVAVLENAPRWPDAEPLIAPIVLHLSSPVQTALLDHRLAGSAVLKIVAHADKNALYGSTLLDTALRADLPLPRSTWDAYVDGVSRPSSLTPSAQALLRSYHLDPARDATSWLVDLLAASARAANEVLPLLLDNPRTVRRFTNDLSHLVSKKGPRGSGARRVQEQFLKEVATNLTGTTQRSLGATLALSSLRASALLSPLGAESSSALTDKRLAEAMRALLTAIVRADGTAASQALVTPPPTADELRGSLEAILAALPIGEQARFETPDLASRWHHLLGMKHVIVELMSGLRTAGVNAKARDVIEVALHNVGVRDIGRAGDAAVFDLHLHDAGDSNATPGEKVVIESAGYQLGEASNPIVLARARVRREG